jgi:pimeloyl-ACP methyl ester carboxylesterase
MKTTIAATVHLGYDLAGNGSVVVLLHAFPLCRTMWQPQLTALQGDFRVLTPDLRGFGGSSPFDGKPSVDQMADDIADLLDALGIKDKVVVGGVSMGGYVSMAFARRHASRLRGLILADTRAEADDATMRAARDEMLAFIQTHSMLDVIDRMLPKLVSPATLANRPDIVDQVRQSAAKLKIAGILAAWEALRDRPDARPGLANIRVPTLALAGSNDELTPPSVLQRIASAISGAQFIEIPGAGHLSNLEQPARFNAELLRFVNSLD